MTNPPIQQDNSPTYVLDGAYVPAVGDMVRFWLGERPDDVCESCEFDVREALAREKRGRTFQIVDTPSVHGCPSCLELRPGPDRRGGLFMLKEPGEWMLVGAYASELQKVED